MNIGFIGAGRVGCSLGRYFIQNGFLISGYYSRSYESACLAAELTGTKPYENLYLFSFHLLYLNDNLQYLAPT